MLHCDQRSVESLGGVFDPVVISAIVLLVLTPCSASGHAESLVWMQQSLSVTILMRKGSILETIMMH